MKNMLKMAVCLMGLIFLTNCASMNPDLPSVCDEMKPEDKSYICETVDKMKIRAENLAEMIVDVNIGAIALGAYKPEDMYFYTGQIREALSQPLSYKAAVELFLKYADLVKSRAMVRRGFDKDKYSGLLLIIVSRHLNHFSSDLIISEFDRGLLLRLLDYMDSQTEAIWALGA